MPVSLIDRSRRLLLIALLAAFAAGCGEDMPEPGSAAYEEAVTSFYTAIAAVEVGEDRRAEELLLRVTEIAPTEAAAWADLGLLALRRNELALAMQRLERAQELAPQESRVAFLLGLVEATRGNAEEAIGYFERARDLDPNNVRAIYALAEQMETLRGEEASDDVRRLVDAILTIQPNNLAVLVERARLEAVAGDIESLTATLDRLEDFSETWTPETVDQFEAVRAAMAAGDQPEIVTELTFFTNVLKRELAYRETLASVRTQPGQPTELIASFIALPSPSPHPAPADDGITFTENGVEAFGAADEDVWAWARTFVAGPSSVPVAAAARAGEVVLAGGPSLAAPGAATSSISAEGFVPGDFNYDFQMDVGLAGEGGFRLYRGNADGTFTDVTDGLGLDASILSESYAAAWAVDFDMEGDLDLVLARANGSPVVLRNNGDETFTVVDVFSEAVSVRDLAWADLDADGDPDAAFLDEAGSVHYFENNRSQGFAYRDGPTGVRALHAADANADGVFDLVLLRADGSIDRHQQAAAGRPSVTQTIASWPQSFGVDARVFAADVDNNGAVDLVASDAGMTTVYLGLRDSTFADGAAEVNGDVFDLADLTGDGRLDLLGVSAEGRVMQYAGSGTRPYRSASLRPIAAETIGDQRINPFGIGGEIEVRSGLLYQKQPISSSLVHFGLGENERVQVARIVWPNGDIQAEFDLATNETVEARQRLKGSCPWLFTYDGERMTFVTDFIWRSPLGLAINGQETAGVMMTEDWVKIEGTELQPRDGLYDVRITAELWETHFFDHVSLMVVDHPVGTEIFVDERFAFPPPELEVIVTDPPTPVTRVTDHTGRDVTDLVAAKDDRYLATFSRGQYQGIAEPHAIEIDLRDAPSEGPLRLLASGWIRPTDSSINVAVAQGSHAPPAGLKMEVPDGDGGWKTVHENLGFPAGKHKTIVLDLTDVFPAEQVVRLSTNLEIYWDALSWAAERPEEAIRTRRLDASRADLRYRGYSAVSEPDRTHPEVPVYDSLASTVQVWQDLTGYYTRFGDVRELLRSVDDRYVIMNAGDEMRFEFSAPAPPPEGWTRDFVLIGDGWVKDGDYNTKFSETVLPLPEHDQPDYEGPRTVLEEDPVYRRHAADWRTYHTRYVTNEALGGVVSR